MTPRTYGPLNRFDPHVRDRHQRPREDPQGRGVLYLAHDLGTALAEAAYGVVRQAAVEVLSSGTYASVEDGVDYGELQALLAKGTG